MLDQTSTAEPLKLEYETRRKERPNEYLRYCRKGTVNNVKIAFVIYSVPKYLEENDVVVSYEMSSLFVKYSKFVGQIVTKMTSVIGCDHKNVLIDSMILRDYIQSADFTWASYECMYVLRLPLNWHQPNQIMFFLIFFLFFVANIQDEDVHVKLQWLDRERRFNSDYLKYEFDQRCKEEERKPKSIKQNIYYCDSGIVNGESIAFLAYSRNKVEIPDNDTERLQIYQLQTNPGQLMIPKKRTMSETAPEIEPKTKLKKSNKPLAARIKK